MSSTLKKHWPAMVLRFRSLIWGLERQMEAGEFDSLKFEAGWMELHDYGSHILQVLSKPPVDEWSKTLKRLTAFRQAVKRFMATCLEEGRPEPMAKVLALCYRCAEKVIDGELLTGGERLTGGEPKDGTAKVPTVEESKPQKGVGGRKKKVTAKEIRDYDKNIKDNRSGVTLKKLSRRWGIPISTIADSPFWKKLREQIREQKRIAKENTQPKSGSETVKGAVARKKRHNEEVEEIDERLDGG